MDNLEIIEQTYAAATKGIKEEWLEKANSKWYDYIAALPKSQKLTYTILVMHDQVLNGGFDQYFTNGYGQFAKDTIPFLKEVNAPVKAELLQKALAAVNTDNYPDATFREKLLKREITALFDSEELSDQLGDLDSEYYDSEDEDIEQLLADHLSKQ